MSQKIQDQLRKITVLFKPLLDAQELFEAVNQAEGRLTDIKAATIKAQKEQKAEADRLKKVKEDNDQSLSELEKQHEIKYRLKLKAIEKLDRDIAKAVAAHDAKIAEMQSEVSRGQETIAELQGQEAALAASVAELKQKLADAQRAYEEFKQAI